MATLRDYEDRADKALQEKLAKYEKQIISQFGQALDSVSVAIAKIYDKYAVDGVLSLSDLTRYNRLASLEKQLYEIVYPAVSDAKKVVLSASPELYGQSFFNYAWTIEMAERISVNWGSLNKFAVVEMLANPFRKGALETLSTTVRAQLRNAINQGLIVGQSYTAMMKDIKKFINIKNFEALRILRTEGQAAINAGQADLYLEAAKKGIDGAEVWDATLDGRTRPAHRSADGQKRGDDGFFVVDGEKALYPAWEGLTASNRINCRCRLRFEVSGLSPALRRVKDKGIIPYQSYDKWLANKQVWK